MFRRLRAPDRDLVSRRLQAELRRSLFDRASPPDRVGRFTVVEAMGSGATGTVFSAYDPQLDRRVALKLVLTTDARRQARAIDEARALAQVNDPNVVSVHDAGAFEDGVFIAMELVPGPTWREIIGEAAHDWRDVLPIVIASGRGLAAAHRQGLVHCDFKPSNVLVGDARQVKVADFGLARALEDIDAHEARRPPGTPAYMAPEQTLGQVDAHSDQYSYCLSAWEALLGRHPLARPTSSSDNANAEATTGRLPSLPKLYALKRKGPEGWPTPTAPRAVLDALRRGLSPDPAKRWPTTDALVAALESAVRKRRDRVLVAGSVVAVSMAVAWGFSAQTPDERCGGAQEELVGIWDESVRAEARAAVEDLELSYTTGLWQSSEAKLDEYAAAWATMHQRVCEATTIRGEQSTETMDVKMACLQRARYRLEAIVDTVLQADAETAARLHELVGGLEPLERCDDIDGLRRGTPRPDATQQPLVDSAELHLARARALHDAGQYDEALTEVEQASDLAVTADYGPLNTDAALIKAEVLGRLGRFPEAEAAWQIAMQSAAGFRRFDAMGEAARGLMYAIGVDQARMDEALSLRSLALGLASDDRELRASTLHNVAMILATKGELEEAEVLQRECLEMMLSDQGREDAKFADALSGLGYILFEAGDYDGAILEHQRALEIRRRELGAGHPEAGASLNNLGSALYAQGKNDEAESVLREAIEIRRLALGPKHPDVFESLHNLAGVLQATGQLEAALSIQQDVLRRWEVDFGPEHPKVATSRSTMADTLMELGRFEEAEAEHRRALAAFEAALGPRHINVANSHASIASCLMYRGDPQAAERELRIALQVLEESVGSNHPVAVTLLTNLGTVLHQQQRFAAAREAFARSVQLGESVLGSDHLSLAMTRHSLAFSLLEAEQDLLRARELAEAAYERHRREDVPPSSRAGGTFLLARVLWRTAGLANPSVAEDRNRARELAATAKRQFHEAGYEDRVAVLEEWLSSRK